MIHQAIATIDDWAGGQDTKTPILKMGLNKSPNMRNWHCAGVPNRIMKRKGFTKVNSSAVETDFLDVAYPPGYQTEDHALRNTAENTQIAQGFKPNTSSTVTKVRLWLKKTGTPAGTDTITIEIQTDSSGLASGTAITNGVSSAVDISDTLTTSYAWVQFTFTTNPSVTAGTQYHIVLKGAFTIGASDYVIWGVDEYDVIYPDGVMSVNDGTTWTQHLHNAVFEVYITGGSKGDDGLALFDFSSRNMVLGIFGTQLYKMDKDSDGTPDGTWDAIGGGSAWDTYTKLMLHCDGTDAGTTFTDEIGKTVTANGDAQLDTAQKKFGTASGLFDGTGDYLSIADSVDFEIDNSDFTIDFQVRFNSLAAALTLVAKWDSINNKRQWILLWTPNILRFTTSSDGTTNVTDKDFSWTPSTGTWYHVEISRSGSNLRAFVDGVQIGTTLTSSETIFNTTTDVTIGAFISDPTPVQLLNGWIDEFRFSKGIARHTANFTAPTAAYSASAIAITSSRYWTFGDWQSGRALINSDIGLYTYVGSGNASLVSAAPLGKFFTIWKNYSFVFGIRGLPNQGRYSTVSDYTTWGSSNTLNFDTNDGDVITGVRTLKGKLYVFKRYSVHRVSYLGSNPTFQVDQILGIGTPSHYSIKEVDMGGEIGSVLIFLTTDKKFAIFDGYNVQILTDLLTEETNDLFASADDQPITFSDMNFTYTDLFHAVVKQDTYEYVLYCVLGSDTAVNYAFVLDYRTGGIYPYDGQIFNSSLYIMSTDKSKILYSAGRAGFMFKMEDGNSDNGSAINAYIVSGKFRPNLPSLAFKIYQIGLHFKEITSASTINMALQFRFDWNVSWNTAQNFNFDHNDELAFGKTVLFDVGTVANMMQIKIKDNSTNPSPTIYEIDLYGKQLGQEVGDRATV